MKQVDLSDIGVKKSLFDDLKTPDINGIIVDWGNDLITALRDKLAKNKSNASGSLSADIKPVIRASAKGVNYIVLMNDYYIDVEEGQQAKQVAYKDILQWMKEKRRYGVFKSAFNNGIESVVDLLKLWKEKYGINLTYNEDIWDVTKRALSGENGVYTHNSVRKDKADVYPHPKLIEALKTL